jgi:ElaB/YqjD/DUF883 family membrane-anchored ribosome-binding protein
MSTTQNRSKRSSKDIDELAEQIETLRADMSSIGDTVSRMTRSGISEAEAVARGKVDEAQNAVRESAGEVEAMVQRNPLQSALIAVGIGFLIGVFARR